MMSAAIWIAIACVVPAVQATRSLSHAARRSPLTKAVLSQHLRIISVVNSTSSTQSAHQASLLTRKSLLHQPIGGSGFASDFFTHDSEKIRELPKYGAKATTCHPKCFWKCGGDCDQVCTPNCAPPRCETSCGPLEVGMCQQRCEEPKCAVVCPGQCETRECPKCKTVCAPPVCHTHCNDECESRCADPQCDWNCKPDPKCVQPECKLDCNNPKECGYASTLTTKVPIAPDRRIMAAGLANLDPKSLPLGAAPPLGSHPPYPAGPMPDGAASSGDNV